VPARPVPTPVGGDDRRVLSPVVRRLLAEHGLDPARVAGSGRDGRITRSDVLAAAAAATAAPPAAAAPPPAQAERADVGPDDEVVALSRARLATARHLHESVATAAHALVVVEVDWGAVDAARAGTGLSYLPFAARAAVDALGRFPHLNATFDVDRLVVHRRVHLGIAVDVAREALLVPVVRDADRLRLRPLATAIADVADRARRRRLPGEAFEGGTFTLTNVGGYGTVLAAPIINPPQVAILSTDGVRMRPVAVPDPASGGWAVAVRPVGNLSLSFDHRAVDGAYAAAFLDDVRTTLQERDWGIEAAS
jgi:2-oxoglutarate dehydrogenase E2 component (dihydrolipoamide succinyltransferase)